jgi:hypothetical protein
LIAFLDSFKAKYPDVPLVVTGHSLGGTQTTAIAMYLSDFWAKNSTVISAQPIAPATAATDLWADRYSRTFAGKSQSYINVRLDDRLDNEIIFYSSNSLSIHQTLDLVPMGFESVKSTTTLWGSYGGPEAPLYIRDIVKFLDCTSGKGYKQPDTKVLMSGSVNKNATTYLAQLMVGLVRSRAELGRSLNFLHIAQYQHFPPAYYALSCQYLVYSNLSVNYFQQLPNNTDITNGCTTLQRDSNGFLLNPATMVDNHELLGSTPFAPFPEINDTDSAAPHTTTTRPSGGLMNAVPMLLSVAAAVAIGVVLA